MFKPNYSCYGKSKSNEIKIDLAAHLILAEKKKIDFPYPWLSPRTL